MKTLNVCVFKLCFVFSLFFVYGGVLSAQSTDIESSAPINQVVVGSNVGGEVGNGFMSSPASIEKSTNGSGLGNRLNKTNGTGRVGNG